MTTTSGLIGPRLKVERERLGLSIEDISSRTNIHKKFLAALENEDFASLPAPLFVVGFLRAYSTAIGLDPDEMVDRFKGKSVHSIPAEPVTAGEQQPAEPESVPRVAEAIKPPPSPYPVVAMGGAAAAAVFGVIIYLLVQAGSGMDESARKQEKQAVPPEVTAVTNEEGVSVFISADDLAGAAQAEPAGVEPQLAAAPGEERPGGETPAGKPAEPVEKPEPDAKQGQVSEVKPDVQPAATPQPETKKPEEAKKPAETRTIAAPTESGDSSGTGKKLTLAITAKERTWYYIVIDGKEVKDVFIEPGSTYRVYADKNIDFTTGKIDASELVLNGKKISLPVRGTNVLKNFVMTEKSVSTGEGEVVSPQDTAAGTAGDQAGR